MNKKLVGIFGVIISILLLVYFKNYSYKLLSFIGINYTKLSDLIKLLIEFGLNIVMCLIIYFIFKKDLKHTRRNANNPIRIFLMFVLYLVIIFVVMYLFKYVNKYIANIFNVELLKEYNYNIFNKELNITLIINIINYYIVIPFLYCSIIILSLDKLFRSNITFVLLSGILSSAIYSLNNGGTLGFLIVNSLSTFVFYAMLSFIYRREKNIWLVIVLNVLYLVLNIVVINYFGGLPWIKV